MKSPKIVFMGSPDFATLALEKLNQSFEVVGVVTQPDKPSGRGKKIQSPPVKNIAQALNIPVYQPNRLKSDEAIQPIVEWGPDLIVVAAFGQILKPNLLNLPQYGCINIHASLLPRWRGAAPINAAILHGDKTTGITIMQMDEGLDTGAMLAQAEINISPDETAGQLFDQLKVLGADLIIESIPKIIANELPATPQEDTLSTYAPMLSKQDGELDFNNSAEHLTRQVRAYHPWPGSYFKHNDRTIKVHKAKALSRANSTPHKKIIIDNHPAVHTSDGILLLTEIQPAGKKRMPGSDFLRGEREWEN